MTTSTTPPLLTPLPPAPLPTDAEAVFDAKAGASLTAQAVMVGEVNTALGWQADSMAATAGSMMAAEGSAAAAANSATVAGQKVELAADQVALAVTAKNAAAASSTSAKSYAQAAGASVGIPTPIANSFLGTDASGNSLWKTVAIPPSQKVGDILISARAPGSEYKVADGSMLLQASYPELLAALGRPGITPPTGGNSASSPLPASTYSGIASSADNVYVSVASVNNASSVYKKNSAGNAFSALSMSSSVSSSLSTAISNDGLYAFFAMNDNSCLSIYKRNSSGAGYDKLPISINIPSMIGRMVTASADGTYCAVGSDTAPYFSVLKRVNDAFVNISSITPEFSSVNTACYCMAFSSDGSYLAIGSGVAPFLSIYKRIGDAFTKVNVPVGISLGAVNGLAWSPDNANIVIGTNGSVPVVCKLYNEMLTRTSAVLPQASYGQHSMAFRPDGKMLAMKGGDGSYVIFVSVNEGGYGSGASINIATNVLAYSQSSSDYFCSYISFLNNNIVLSSYGERYPFNPVLEFQLPVANSINGSISADNVSTGYKGQSVATYIKVKESM